MANPLITQGTLNRALTSVSVVEHPELNVTSGFFGTKVASISFEGEASDYISTLTGAVPSPRLYQMVTVTMYLNKSQFLSSLWEQQRLTDTGIGDVNIVTDSPTLVNYYIQNCILQNIPSLDLTGESNDYPVTLKGIYSINGSLFA